MTFRAIILGLIGAAFVCSYTYFNDWIMRQTMFVGNSMPISVYGFLVLFLAIIVPLWQRVTRRGLLTRSELVVILVLVLASCAIPGSNLLRLFPPTLVMPHHFDRTEPGWQQHNVLQMLPDGMLVDISEDESVVLDGYLRGLAEASDRMSFQDIPWSAWRKSLFLWIPIILSLWITLVSLAVVVHRQWSQHEHLPYPIVTFTKSLLPEADGKPSPVFGNPLFWIGLGAVFTIHFYNYLNVWFDDVLFGRIPLGINFAPLSEMSSLFHMAGGRWILERYTIYFTVLAVAYFLPKEVSLSLGVGPFVWYFISGLFITYGIGAATWQGNSTYFGIRLEPLMIMGAYFGMLMVLLYTGRQYYSNVFRQAVGVPTREKVEASAIWSARISMFGLLFFTVYCSLHAGLDWPIAFMFGLGCVAVYLVMGRLIAETGLFFISTVGTPATVIWAVFGSHALGPEMLLIMFVLCLVVFYDTREALMPYVVNGLKLADDCNVKIGRIALAVVAALLVGLAVGIPTTLYFQYERGMDMSLWQVEQTKQPFNETIGMMQRLDAQGQLEDAGGVTGLKRFTQASPHRNGLIVFTSAAGLVLLFSFLRLRFTGWPLHPVMFLVWSTYAGTSFAQAFLYGWLIKVLITRFGGAGVYQKCKPLMFGLIAGEMLGGLVPMVVSLIYYLITDEIPKSFLIMPF